VNFLQFHWVRLLHENRCAILSFTATVLLKNQFWGIIHLFDWQTITEVFKGLSALQAEEVHRFLTQDDRGHTSLINAHLFVNRHGLTH
jgi:hypothetical protein